MARVSHYVCIITIKEVKLLRNDGKGISNVSLHLTEECNLRCDYCFVHKNPKIVSEEVAKQAIDFLCHPVISKNDKDLNVHFFGGEPFMRWELMQKLWFYGKEAATRAGKNMYFGVTTNGTLFDEEKLKWLEKHKIGILLSIDGTKESQNLHRKTKNGKGSWELIEPWIPALLELQPNMTARLTYTPETLPMLADNIEFLLDELGFKTVAPSCAYDNYKRFTDKDWEEWDRQYERIIQRAIRKIKAGESPGDTYFDKCFRQLNIGEKMTAPCGAGRKYLGISPDGTLHPCHRFVQWKEWIIGDIWNGIDEAKRNVTQLYNCNLVSPKCATCDNGFCGGICLAANYNQNGSIWVPCEDGCIVSKKQWDAAMRIAEATKDVRPKRANRENRINVQSRNNKIVNQEHNVNRGLNINGIANQFKQMQSQIDRLNKAMKTIGNVLVEHIEKGE